MKVEIWSDVVCPFCYIGKRRLEKALSEFSHREQVEVIWRSFELDPEAAKNPSGDILNMLTSKYGITREQAQQMNDKVSEQAAKLGLDYHLQKAIPANSFDAHRIAHLAAKHGLQDQAEERLFSAFFVEGKHIGDRETLKQLADEIGLDQGEVAEMLEGDAYSAEVRSDEQEAQRLGIHGVPFFVIDRKHAISGAHPVEVFLETLEKAWEEK